MGRRVLFTKREIEKYSRTYEGRQYMNSTHKKVGIQNMAFGVGVFILFLVFNSSSTEGIQILSYYLLLICIILLIYGLGKFLIYRAKYNEEESLEYMREQERQAQQRELERKRKIAQEKENARLQLLRQAPFEKIDNMGGFEFEEYCTVLLKDLGYSTHQTKKSGDFGADIIISNQHERIIVQTKRYNHKVSVSAVQEISTAKNYYHIQNAWIITNNYFTAPAKQLAQANNVHLIDRDALAQLISQANKKNT